MAQHISHVTSGGSRRTLGQTGRSEQLSVDQRCALYDSATSAVEIRALPLPSDGRIFSDGFESGDPSAWQ